VVSCDLLTVLYARRLLWLALLSLLHIIHVTPHLHGNPARYLSMRNTIVSSRSGIHLYEISAEATTRYMLRFSG
jgi:hypothetical protein